MKTVRDKKSKTNYRPLLSQRAADSIIALFTPIYFSLEEFLFFYYYVKPTISLNHGWALRYAVQNRLLGIATEIMVSGSDVGDKIAWFFQSIGYCMAITRLMYPYMSEEIRISMSCLSYVSKDFRMLEMILKEGIVQQYLKYCLTNKSIFFSYSRRDVFSYGSWGNTRSDKIIELLNLYKVQIDV